MLSRGRIVVALAIGALTACNRYSPKDDTPNANPVTNTNAIVNTSPGTDISSAVNASSVWRYEDESRLTQSTSKLRDAPTVARTAPYSEEVVAVVSNGAAVTEIAREGDWYLVLFNDPRDIHSGKRMAGWIYKDAILGPAADIAGTSPVNNCHSGEVHVLADNTCRLACAHDTDCATTGGVCDGMGEIQSGLGPVEDGKYCVFP
jgi:hypothetical protein